MAARGFTMSSRTLEEVVEEAGRVEVVEPRLHLLARAGEAARVREELEGHGPAAKWEALQARNNSGSTVRPRRVVYES